ncbi:MAG: tRNA (adenosine(37)-N6)-threonylcarbamoyltransferase complex dimerization subunit type 1 TsaB [Desulfitobacteriaceae bacterium]|nr:tRNA (adenosine(37)-N6)-threonylcarbamoyltransferase complex dimerization subunit type 1 TsaB [Desulfitobacteriaceae bacterium]MDI6913041.1 tRNA (adenosine(37)-N6)-threonylcarbamoyltransferase complex dimerization subunit type 1 TsaB [Desulfitobacteriaceae bacterium]
MKFLTIDTTTKVTALALAEAGSVVAEGFLHTRKTHSERLLPMLDQLLTAADWKLKELGFIGVVRGPGSFTGIRIGLATAQGMAQVLKLPLVGVLSLDALAWAGWGRSELIVPLLDARKHEWYTAAYRFDDLTQRPERVLPPQASAPEEWVLRLADMGERILFVGDAVTPYEDYLHQALGDRLVILPEYVRLPRGAYTVQAVWQKWMADPQGERVEPYYIRKSEAEVNWERKFGGKQDD